MMMENKNFRERRRSCRAASTRRKSRLCASISGLIEEPDTHHLFLSVCEQRSHHTYIRHAGKRGKKPEAKLKKKKEVKKKANPEVACELGA
jgi:hypothetical protein